MSIKELFFKLIDKIKKVNVWKCLSIVFLCVSVALILNSCQGLVNANGRDNTVIVANKSEVCNET